MLLRQLSYAIKNQLGHPKPPTRSYYRRPYAIKKQKKQFLRPLLDIEVDQSVIKGGEYPLNRIEDTPVRIYKVGTKSVN